MTYEAFFSITFPKDHPVLQKLVSVKYDDSETTPWKAVAELIENRGWFVTSITMVDHQ